MNVLVIPEDFRNDQHVLGPIISAMLDSAGGPRAKVKVCTDPPMRGVGDALNWNRIEARAMGYLSSDQRFFGENAWQELEVWILAGLEPPPPWPWSEIRREVNPKEMYFEPLAAQRGVGKGLGGGRKVLAAEAARRYGRIRQLCPEDVGALDALVRSWLGGVEQ